MQPRLALHMEENCAIMVFVEMCLQEEISLSVFKARQKEQNFLLSVIMMTIRMLFFVILLLALVGTGLLTGVGKAWIETAPELDMSFLHSQAQNSYIYDKYGNLIAEYRGSENRIYASLHEMPANLVNAVIATEDARFFDHNGVDLKRILGSLVANLRGSSQGGSTITQQLVRNTLLTPEQTLKRKAQEAYLAIQMTKELSKNEVLEEYLNTIFMGGSNYGMKVAALDYFGKELYQLSLRECACLAAMISSPNSRNPRRCYYVTNTPERIEDRVDWVLGRMLQLNYITQAEYDEAKNQTLRASVKEKSTISSNTMYDHAYYVEYAIYDVVTKMLRMDELEDTSTNRALMERKLRTGGYHIYTSLDPELQDAVQQVITDWNNYPATRYSSDAEYRSSLGNGEYLTLVQPQAAAAVIDWSTGEIVAIIGGRQEPVQKKLLNRAYQMNMPVGSSIKPLAVYGPAFDMGYSPGTPVLNLPIPINGWVSENGYPSNYGGGGFNGVETLRMAMTKSHNTSTAQALYSYVGIENSVNYLLRLGVDPDHILANGSGLGLGSSGLSVIELAAGFAALANLGTYQEPYAFSRVMNSDGTTFIDISSVQIRRQAFKPSTAWMTVDVLKDCVTAAGTGSRANFGGFTVAGKTGTNSNNIGVTFAGMTGYYSAAVWIGSDNYKPLVTNATGGSFAAPLWSAVMAKVHSVKGIYVDRDIITRSASSVGLVKAKACGVSGMKPTKACQNDANEYGITNDFYLSGTEPKASCNMHRAVSICNKSKKRATSKCSSKKTMGVIYIPQGHPLRMAEHIDDIHEYFRGASYDEDYSNIGRCSSCK